MASIYDIVQNQRHGFVIKNYSKKSLKCYFECRCIHCDSTCHIVVEPITRVSYVVKVQPRKLSRYTEIDLDKFTERLNDTSYTWIFEYTIECTACGKETDITMTPDRRLGMVYSSRVPARALKLGITRAQTWIFPLEVQWALWRAYPSESFHFHIQEDYLIADQMLDVWRKKFRFISWRSLSQIWGLQRPDLNDAPLEVKSMWQERFSTDESQKTKIAVTKGSTSVSLSPKSFAHQNAKGTIQKQSLPLRFQNSPQNEAARPQQLLLEWHHGSERYSKGYAEKVSSDEEGSTDSEIICKSSDSTKTRRKPPVQLYIEDEDDTDEDDTDEDNTDEDDTDNEGDEEDSEDSEDRAFISSESDFDSQADFDEESDL